MEGKGEVFFSEEVLETLQNMSRRILSMYPILMEEACSDEIVSHLYILYHKVSQKYSYPDSLYITLSSAPKYIYRIFYNKLRTVGKTEDGKRIQEAWSMWHQIYSIEDSSAKEMTSKDTPISSLLLKLFEEEYPSIATKVLNREKGSHFYLKKEEIFKKFREKHKHLVIEAQNERRKYAS